MKHPTISSSDRVCERFAQLVTRELAEDGPVTIDTTTFSELDLIVRGRLIDAIETALDDLTPDGLRLVHRR